MKKKRFSCFGALYSASAKECQICSDSISCWSDSMNSAKRSVINNGYHIAIVNIISECKKATMTQVKKGLEKRFPGKELNIYYYLSVLKKHGFIDVEIRGRQRYYALR